MILSLVSCHCYPKLLKPENQESFSRPCKKLTNKSSMPSVEDELKGINCFIFNQHWNEFMKEVPCSLWSI